MVDVPLFAKSLKSAWIKKYLDQSNRGKWKLFFAANLRELDDQKKRMLFCKSYCKFGQKLPLRIRWFPPPSSGHNPYSKLSYTY